MVRYPRFYKIARLFAQAGLLLAAPLLALTLWLSGPPLTEGRYANPAAAGQLELAAPVHFAPATQDRTDTAFREDEAGFSAYYRAPRPDADTPGDASPRLEVDKIHDKLLEPPHQSNPVRSGAGSSVDLGANFAIAKVPLFAARGVSSVTTDVTLYFDDQGWIVAYLPHDAPAAQIWRHQSAPGETYSDSKANEHLENNLLALAIDEVLTINKVVASDDPDALDAPPRIKVPRNKVGYYHWQHPDCDAFLLFSGITDGGESVVTRFVIPTSIKNVQASAVALITTHPEQGETTSARVLVDDAPVAVAQAPTYHQAESFELSREGETTSVHGMSVSTDAKKSAAGVVMLVYDKP